MEIQNFTADCQSQSITPPANINPDLSCKWLDVTTDFFEHVKELSLGELLHDSMFGLFDAMSAIEMMDPKMDAGMMCNRGKKRAMTFDQAVKLGKLKLCDFTPEEQIGIIDTTLACLVTWLEGHSLAQTIFTNLYLHKPYEIEDRTMKAFCIGILKTVDMIKEFINRAGVYEEEDFQPVVYGFRLAPEVSEQRAAGMLREVEEELQRKIKSTRVKQDNSTRNIQMQLEHDDAVAVYSRIKFLRLFYQSFLTLLKREASSVGECQKFLAGCSELIVILQCTICKGIQPDIEVDADNKVDYPTIMGFEPLVNQRLLPPTFPRYTKLKSREEAVIYLEELMLRLQNSCKITMATNFHSALDFFLEFSELGPCVLSRSVLQLIYLPPCNKVLGSNTLVEVLKDSARTFIGPPCLIAKSPLMANQQSREYVETFLNHCVRPFGALIQICGHNRARQRDKLAQLLEDFATLQDEAERVDAYLHSVGQKPDMPRQNHLACFGTWILYHTLLIMIRYLLSGFELELYSTHEFHYIYWYLYEFLYGWLASSLNRADSVLIEQEIAVEKQKGRNNKKNKTKRRKTRPYAHEIAMSQSMQALCGGYYKALVGFCVSGKIHYPNPEFDNEQVRYEHRFAPFSSIRTPPLVHYAQFHEMTDLSNCDTTTSSTMYMAACRNFHHARSLLEMIVNPDNEVQQLLKITKTNFVVMKLLAGGHKKDSKVPPEFDFSQHHHFPIIKLV